MSLWKTSSNFWSLLGEDMVLVVGDGVSPFVISPLVEL